MRQGLDIDVTFSLVKSITGYQTCHGNVGLCIIGEKPEGEYSCLEHRSGPGVVDSLEIITRAKTNLTTPLAFHFALANNHKVTCIHETNIMKLADSLSGTSSTMPP